MVFDADGTYLAPSGQGEVWGDWAIEDDQFIYRTTGVRIVPTPLEKSLLAQKLMDEGKVREAMELARTGAWVSEADYLKVGVIDGRGDGSFTYTLARHFTNGQEQRDHPRNGYKFRCTSIAFESESKPIHQEPQSASAEAGHAQAEAPAAADDAAARASAGPESAPVATADDASASAAAPAQRCVYLGAPEWAGVPPVIEKSCTEPDTPFEACTQFSVRFANGVVLDHLSIGVPVNDDDGLALNPAGVNFYEETVGGDGYVRWEVYLQAPGGGRVAEERWRVFDDQGHPISPLMDAVSREAWKARKDQPDEGLSLDGPTLLNTRCSAG